MPHRSTPKTQPQSGSLRDAPTSRFSGRHIYLIGIGGCGMSGLARMLRELGAICCGSDCTPSDLTEALTRDGIAVTLDQSSGELPEQCDLVVASAAIKPDHPELIAAQSRGTPIYTYAEMLGQVQMERTGVSIAGTHGKSTTSAMLCHILIECGLDPSFIIGANCAQIGGGSRTGSHIIPGNSHYAGRPGILIAEACEFNRSFHHHRPVIGLINNIEADHLDVYGSLDNVVAAFREFAAVLPSEDDSGRLLIAHEGAHRREITGGLSCEFKTFGYSPASDYQVVTDQTVQRIGVLDNGHWLAQWTLSMPGEHNALNSAAAAIIANWLGAGWDEIGGALDSFQGIERRMQRLGVKAINGGHVVIYDDYGHHPTEIEKTLKALRAAERPERLICVFQPHQHSRTRFLLEQFAESFSSADVVIVPHIYFVRDSEIEKQRVSASDLVDRLRQRNVMGMHLYPFEAIVEQLQIICRPDDLLVIMGAGPVWKVARQFLQSG